MGDRKNNIRLESIQRKLVTSLPVYDSINCEDLANFVVDNILYFEDFDAIEEKRVANFHRLKYQILELNGKALKPKGFKDDEFICASSQIKGEKNGDMEKNGGNLSYATAVKLLRTGFVVPFHFYQEFKPRSEKFDAQVISMLSSPLPRPPPFSLFL